MIITARPSNNIIHFRSSSNAIVRSCMMDHIPLDTASYPTSNAFSRIHHLALADIYDDIDLHLMCEFFFFFIMSMSESHAASSGWPVIASLCPTLNGLVVKMSMGVLEYFSRKTSPHKFEGATRCYNGRAPSRRRDSGFCATVAFPNATCSFLKKIANADSKGSILTPCLKLLCITL